MNGKVAQIGTLAALDGFLVTSADYLSAYSEELLTYLYQPLTGAVGFSLYHILETQVHHNDAPMLLSERKAHIWLLTMLGEDLTSFFTARSKLEALGLLQSYKKSDKLGTYYIYVLHAPLAPKEFFAEPLLSEFLRQQVEDDRYNEILDHFAQQRFDLGDYTEVTQDFTTVFSAEASRVLHHQQQAAAVAQQAALSPKPRYTNDQLRTFDWDLLTASLQFAQINRDQINAHAQTIFMLHEFYKINEVDMARLIGNTMNLMTNEIDDKRLRSVARQQFAKQGPSVRAVDAPPVTMPRLTEQEILQAAKTLSPAEFLRWNHAKLNTLVGVAENSAVMSITQRHVLPDSVVNIMINYAVTMFNVVNQIPMEKMVNDFLRSHVDTPEKALAHIRARAQKQQGGNSQRSNFRKPAAIPPKTKQPAWADPNYKAPEAKEADPEVKKRLAERLARYRAENRESEKKQKGGAPS